MEKRKSYKADLEHQRISGFLLGLVVVLAVFLVALEFTTRNGPQYAAGDMLDDLSQDIEIIHLLNKKDTKAAAIMEKSRSFHNKINPVDTETDDVTEEKEDDSKEASTKADIDDNTSTDNMRDTWTASQSETLPPIATDRNDNPLDFHVVERLPEFPGGMVEFMKWLTKNLQYPALARQQKIQGKVLVSFIINKDGVITDPNVVSSAGQELDQEALRVIRIMPKWKPGEDNGKPCRTYFLIPIIFKL